MPMGNGSTSSHGIPGRSVVLRTNPFYCRSRGNISTARRCARTGKPDYSRVVRKVENHGISSGCLQGGCKSRFAAGSPGSQGKGFVPEASFRSPSAIPALPCCRHLPGLVRKLVSRIHFGVCVVNLFQRIGCGSPFFVGRNLEREQARLSSSR